MLARRFAVVCFILMLFGMWFSSLVAQVERPSAAGGARAACLLVDSPLCRMHSSY